jgi:3-deoxy-D-manno-octulosonic-acid transferase
LLVIIETELWPNTIHACAVKNIPVILANARLSEKSARGYRRFAGVATPMLRELNTVVAQNAEDGARFVALGLPARNLVVSGSIKFDIALDADLIARAQQARKQWRGAHRFIWIAASTHAGEDEIILQAHRQLRARFGDALLILVPRHPERFNDVAALIEKNNFHYVRRSASPATADDIAVLLGDTMGELLFLFGCADCAFVGGSLIARGGHNTLEPAAWGLPIITGSSDFNFREISALLRSENALCVVGDAEALAQRLIELAGNAGLRQRMGDAARQVVVNNRGALAKLTGAIESFL